MTYPDGSFESYAYDRLDLVSYTDRQYGTWTYVYDASRRLVSVTDPQNLQTQYGYNRNGQLTSLTDPRSNVTSWTYDVQGRLTGIAYTGAVNPTPNVGFTWDPYFPRLVSRTEGAGTTQFSYAVLEMAKILTSVID